MKPLLSRTMYIDPVMIVENYGVIGDRDKAFTWLEKAASEGSAFFFYIKVDPSFDPIRCDPRFAAMVKRLGFPE